MRVTTALAGICAAALGMLAAASPAAATPTHTSVSPSFTIPDGLDWAPYRTQPFTSPAGLSCSFTLSGTPVLDEEEIATLATNPDGTPLAQVIRGDLRVRYTNVDTGTSVERDLDGTGVIYYGSDGSTTFALYGPAAVGFRPTDPYPAGFYALDGFHVIYTAPQRAYRDVVVDLGTEHNICTDLA